MENFATEIISTITEAYSDDGDTGKELIRDMLKYLYDITDDDEMCNQICNWFTVNGYCLGCRTKLLSYEYLEDEKPYVVSLCPNCDSAEIEEGKYKLRGEEE